MAQRKGESSGFRRLLASLAGAPVADGRDSEDPGISLFRALADSTAAGIFVQEEGGLRYANAGARALTGVSGSHTMYLEELGVEPGDFIAYYAKATDSNTVRGGRTTTSDIYFVKVLPFTRDFRQAQSQEGGGGGGGGGGQQSGVGALSEQQRQIISATFNVERDKAKTSADKFKEDTVFLGLSQARLQARTAVLRDADVRVAVGAVGQRQHVAGINKVRILDLRIDLPDLGPEPGVLEEHRRDIPQRVATLDGVVHRRVGADELRGLRGSLGGRHLVHGRDGRLGRGHVVGRIRGLGGRGRRRGGGARKFLGRRLAARQEHGGGKEGHETQEARRYPGEYARLFKLLIRKHPPLLNP